MPPAATTASPGTRTALSFDKQLALVTVVPWFVYLFMYLTGANLLPLAILALFLSSPHVLATFGLYVDPGLRSVIRSHPVHYFVVPGSVLLLSIVLFSVSRGKVTLYLLTGFLLWQIFHFAKQNLGVASFWLKARRMPGLSTNERRLIRATFFIGAIGILRAVEIMPHADPYLHIAGCIAVALGLIFAYVPNDNRRTLMLVCVVMFFSPTVLFRYNIVVLTGVYSVAHGAQYYLMVGKTVATKRNVVRATIPFVLIGSFIIVYLGSRSPYIPIAWTFGLAKGIVAWHFIADARLWRMSDPDIRTFLKSRFSFL
jgi:hypothetical protein